MPSLRRTALAAAIIAAGLTGAVAPTPAVEAAPYVPGERLDYDTGENPRDIGDWPAGIIWVDRTWVEEPSLWDVPAAVAAVRKSTGLDVRIAAKGQDLSKASALVTVSSDRDGYTGPTGKRLGDVALWSTKSSATGNRWILDAADVTLDDTDGAKASKAVRAGKLRSYLTQAVGQ